MAIGAYLTLFLPYVMGKTVDFDKEGFEMSPIVMVASAGAVLSVICFPLAIWSVYKLLSIPIAVVLLVGFLRMTKLPGIFRHLVSLGFPKPTPAAASSAAN